MTSFLFFLLELSLTAEDVLEDDRAPDLSGGVLCNIAHPEPIGQHCFGLEREFREPPVAVGRLSTTG